MIEKHFQNFWVGLGLKLVVAILIKPGEDFTNKYMLKKARKKQLEEAKEAFANALALKPKEILPKQRIHEVDSLIQQNIRLAAIDKAYKAAIQQGKQLYEQKQYEKALISFKKAKVLKPGDAYSGKMMQSIETTLATIARTKALQRAYDESNARAGQLLKEQKYELAKAQYQNSLTLKPDESYPKKQIADINTALVRLAKERDLTVRNF